MCNRSCSYLRIVGFLLVLAITLSAALHAPPLRARTGITVPILVQGHVDLQRPNAPPPHPSWVVPLTITLFTPGTTDIRYTWHTQTDERGDFSLVETFEPGLYDVRVKNFHTLRNVKYNVLFTSSPNVLNLGTLKEGDATDDNRVNVADFTLLRNAYFTEEGMPGFDPRTDFDEDNRINVRDFALLRGNYFTEGDLVVPRLTLKVHTPPVAILAQPQRVNVRHNEVAPVTVWIDAGESNLVGADVVVTFDPTVLQVVDAHGSPADKVTPGDAFDIVLKNNVDNAKGRITFGAGTFGAAVTGQHMLFAFRILGLKNTDAIGTPLSFSYVDVVDSNGRSLRTQAYPARVQVGSFAYLYAPATFFGSKSVQVYHIPMIVRQRK